MKANVYDIHTGRQRTKQEAANEAQPVPHSSSPHKKAPRLAGMAARGLLGAFRYGAFLLLYWLRGPLRGLLGLCATLSLIALPMVALGMEASPSKTNMLLSLFAAGFGSFLLSWLYDSLLLRLSP